MADVDELRATALREAAQARAAAGADVLAQPPSGQARSVSTAWMRASRDARTNAVATLPPRVRARKVEKDGKPFYVLEGYFTVYERGYEMWDWYGPYTEIVSAGAGDQTIAADPDVVFLINHRGLALARTVNGTLDLWSDDTGGGNRAWLNPQRTDVRDLVAAVEDGVVTEQSFAFMITAGRWSPDYSEYRIDGFDIDRGDTSAVNYGANPATSVAARAREILEELDHLPAGAARHALDRLRIRTEQVGDNPARSAVPTGPSPAPVAATSGTTERGQADEHNGRSLSSVDAWLAATGTRTT